jgi:hypothetical protein
MFQFDFCVRIIENRLRTETLGPAPLPCLLTIFGLYIKLKLHFHNVLPVSFRLLFEMSHHEVPALPNRPRSVRLSSDGRYTDAAFARQSESYDLQVTANITLYDKRVSALAIYAGYGGALAAARLFAATRQYGGNAGGIRGLTLARRFMDTRLLKIGAKLI